MGAVRGECALRVHRDRLLDTAGAVEVDLTVDLRSVQHGALDDLRVVARKLVLDSGEIRDSASHPDEGLRGRMAGEPRELSRDHVERRGERSVRNGTAEGITLGEADGPDVQAESLVDAFPVAERELRAAAARIEHHERTLADPQPCSRGEVREAGLLLSRDDLDLGAGALSHCV
jgi:hypothetical protein